MTATRSDKKSFACVNLATPWQSSRAGPAFLTNRDHKSTLFEACQSRPGQLFMVSVNFAFGLHDITPNGFGRRRRRFIVYERSYCFKRGAEGFGGRDEEERDWLLRPPVTYRSLYKHEADCFYKSFVLLGKPVD